VATEEQMDAAVSYVIFVAVPNNEIIEAVTVYIAERGYGSTKT